MPPPILEDPWEALCLVQGGKPAAFLCPVEKCVNVNGLNFSRNGWHPFSAVLHEYAHREVSGYQGSILEKYYEKWQPQSAADAWIGFMHAPKIFKDLPPYFMYLFPWTSKSPEELEHSVRTWYRDDNREHGRSPDNLDIAGFKEHGPVSPEVGDFEFNRLTSVLDSLLRQGYRRERGDVRVVMVKRGKDLRFLNFGGGLHRTAAMCALGREHVPATCQLPSVVDRDHAKYWPQVRRGIWSESEAIAYIDHLFDFDALEWAKKMDLTVPDPARSLAGS
jgi:hypothetical protein